VSLAKQAGNADDVLMDALHGRRWRDESAAPPGRRRRHLATAGAGIAGALAALTGRRRLAAVAGAAWLAQTAELTWRRVAPGPRTPGEVTTMVVTSVAMPFAAGGWWLYGHAALRSRLADSRRAPHGALRPGRRRPATWPAAVLFDRDGTLVVDVPYNGDPERVQPVPTARAALAKLRRAGIPTGVVSNQSGIARGLLTPDQVRAVNQRIEDLLGPLGPWAWCPHAPEDECACRKPAPGLVYEAARRLGVDPRDVAVVGDIGADVEAARAAGARAVMVPTERTRAEEVAAAPQVAADLESAVDLLLAEAR
jgi:histidinol-phosphate phosphatase family protein